MNYQTFNVSYWIKSDNALRRIASQCNSYAEFVRKLRANVAAYVIGYATPDNVAWCDKALDVKALDNVIKALYA